MEKFIASQNWRNFFEDSGLKNQSYKLFIETAYGCHADCYGCPIPKENRAAKEPKWDLEKLSPILDNFAKNLTVFRTDRNLPSINNLAITVGPAENLIFEEQYLRNLAQISKKFSNDIGAKYFHLAISTSGLFSTEKVKPKLEALKDVLNENELAFAWIFNLRQFSKTPQHYYKFAEFIFQYTNLVELEINMDSSIHLIEDDVLKQFGDFVSSFPFVQLDFAYAINDGNITKTYLKNREFIDFIEKTRLLTGANLKQYFSQWDQKLDVNSSKNYDFEFEPNFKLLTERIYDKSIRLNALGQWHFAQTILGNIYFDENFSLKPLGLSMDNPFNKDSLIKFNKQFRGFLTKQIATHNPCDECKHKNICLSSGYLTYTKFSPAKEESCTNPAYAIFESKIEQ